MPEDNGEARVAELADEASDDEETDEGEYSYLTLYNHYFEDLRWIDFEIATQVLDFEKQIVHRIRGGLDPAAEPFAFFAEIMGDDPATLDLLECGDAAKVFAFIDVGVASSVAAISAFGSVPYSSCNGGIFGGDHLEKFPLVAFLPTEDEQKLEMLARAVGVEVWETTPGLMVCRDGVIEPMLQFAEKLLGEVSRKVGEG